MAAWASGWISAMGSVGKPKIVEERDRAAPIRPLSLAWITDELLAETKDVWSEVYGRPIDDAEAIEILVNTKRFVQVLLDAARGER